MSSLGFAALQLRPNSHCLCVSRWERYVPCQGASRASRAPGASGRRFFFLMCARLLLWLSYALGGAAVRACCCGRRTRSVELQCAPIVAAFVRTQLSCWARQLLTIDRPS